MLLGCCQIQIDAKADAALGLGGTSYKRREVHIPDNAVSLAAMWYRVDGGLHRLVFEHDYADFGKILERISWGVARHRRQSNDERRFISIFPARGR